jgi:hypothetical protein
VRVVLGREEGGSLYEYGQKQQFGSLWRIFSGGGWLIYFWLLLGGEGCWWVVLYRWAEQSDGVLHQCWIPVPGRSRQLAGGFLVMILLLIVRD